MPASLSTGWPRIRQPQCSQAGAIMWMAHSKLSNVPVWFPILTVNMRPSLLPGLIAGDAITGFEEGQLFGASLIRALGTVPNEYLHYFYYAADVVDSLRAGTIMRERAQEMGALTSVPTVEVTGMDVEHGRVRRVCTSKGDIEVDTVVIACGVWSPRLARMAGAEIPLTPTVHQMISIGPVPQFAETMGEINFPIIRDMDTLCYERQPIFQGEDPS